MFPRPFEYERPQTVADALSAIGATDREVRPLAGGQSLVPMMTLGLARPELLVDLADLPLEGHEKVNGSVRLGALTCHRELELGAEMADLLPLASEAAGYIGNPRVRNRGTVGGNLAHSDPASELGAVLLVHGGRVMIEGPSGERKVEADDFFLGMFETAVEPGELVTAVEFDLPPEGSGHGFHEVAGRADDYATAAACAIVSTDGAGTCEDARIALIAVADHPIRVPEAEDLCRGERLGEELLQGLRERVEAAISPESDPFISGEYRKRVAGASAARAVEAAFERSEAA